MILYDQPGLIRAYKVVNTMNQGIFRGGITYHVSEKYAVPDANTDPYKNCGAGIHVATLDWCYRHYLESYKILVVEFTAADIAAIPLTSDGKFRLFRCTVIAEKTIGKPMLSQEN